MTTIGSPSLPTQVNRCLDPSMQSGNASAQNTATASSYTFTLDTAIFHSGTQSVRLDRLAASPSTTIGVANLTCSSTTNVNRLPVVPGEVISIAVWMRCTVPNWTSRLQLSYRDSSGAVTGSQINGPSNPSNPTGTWLLVKYENITVIAGAAYLTVQASALMPSGNTVGGEQMWCDDLIVNSGPVALSYFDGRSPGCVWAGAPDISLSVRGLRSITQLNRCMDPSMESGSTSAQSSPNVALFTLGYDTTIAHSGTRSAVTTRQAATLTNQIGALYFTATAAALAQGRVSVTPGEAISAALWVRCATDQCRASVSVQWRNAGGALLSSTTGPLYDSLPGGQWSRIAYENMLVPAGAVWAGLYCNAYLALNAVAVGGEQVWFDDAVIVSGSKVPVYFDGNSSGCVWLSGAPGWWGACRPIGPWSVIGSTGLEQPLNLAGQWDGTALQPVDLRDVSVV